MTNKEFFIASWKRDCAITVKAIRALPSDIQRLNQQHHPKFRSPWQLINHIAPHARELAQGFSEGRMDLVNEGLFPLDGPTIYPSVEAAANDLESASARLLELVAACSEEDWNNNNIPVYWGAMKIMDQPMMKNCWMMLWDSIHHRGQLSSYYRLLSVSQPELMGPTTEVEEAMMSSASGSAV